MGDNQEMKDEEKKNQEKDQEKTFVVRDKRFSATKEEKEDRRAAAVEGKTEEPQKGDASAKVEALPEIDFNSFIFSLSTSALIQLGEIEDPFTQKEAKNLPLAKQTIDLIGMLKEKTKGNLTPQEEKVLENILYDLRMRYVKAAG
jgi:hypothetical protein